MNVKDDLPYSNRRAECARNLPFLKSQIDTSFFQAKLLGQIERSYPEQHFTGLPYLYCPTTASSWQCRHSHS